MLGVTGVVNVAYGRCVAKCAGGRSVVHKCCTIHRYGGVRHGRSRIRGFRGCAHGEVFDVVSHVVVDGVSVCVAKVVGIVCDGVIFIVSDAVVVVVFEIVVADTVV